MPSLEENILGLYNTSKQVLDRATGELNAREAKLNASLLDFDSKAVGYSLNLYDRTIHNKTSLNIVPDPLDPTVSEWVTVPNDINGYKYNFYQYYAEGSLVIVNTHLCYGNYPGYYETPQYSKDTSMTRMQFVIGNTGATSKAINDRLLALNLTGRISTHGDGWAGTTTIRTTAIHDQVSHPYSRLFVRFKNLTVSGTNPPQEITTYGGDSSFNIAAVKGYSGIKF